MGYDFRISQPALVQALEAYREMENVLLREGRKQKENVTNMKKNWYGEAAATFTDKYRDFLEEGSYGQAYEQVKGMREALEEALPFVNRLLARCEGFAEELLSDSYEEPVRPAEGDNREWNGGILSLDYSTIEAICYTCDEIYEENKRLAGELASIIESCSSVMDVSGELAGLEEALRKANRIQNFKESFQRYANGVRALESELTMKLRVLTQTPVSEAASVRPFGVESAGRIEDPDGIISLLAEIRASGGHKYVQKAAELLYYTDGKYAYEELLEKGELSQEETEALSWLYQGACKRIEKADTEVQCRTEIEIVERFLEGLYTVSSEMEKVDTVNVKVTYIVSKDRLIEELAANIREQEKGSVAYKALAKIHSSKTPVAGYWFQDAFLKGEDVSEYEEFQQTKKAGVRIEHSRLGAEVRIQICPEASNRRKHAEEGRRFFTVNGEARSRKYVDSLDKSIIKRMETLGYSKSDMAKQYAMLENKEDEKFWDSIAAGKYQEAFKTHAEELSDNAGAVLAAYAVRLGELLEENAELEDFLNEMLYKDIEQAPYHGYYPEDYIELMAAQTECIRRSYTAVLFTGKVSGEEARKYSRILGSMSSLWHTLGREVQEIEVRYLAGCTERYYTYQCRNVEACRNGISLELFVTDKRGGELIQGYRSKELTASVIWSPSEVSGDYGLEELKKIQERTDTLWADYAVSTAIQLMSIGCPEAGSVLTLLSDLYKDKSAGAFFQDAQAQTIDGKGMPDACKTLSSVLSGITGYQEAKQELQRSYEKEAHRNMLPWFYSADEYQKGGNDGDSVYIKDGIYNYDVIQGILKWNQEGCGAFIPSEEMSSEEISAMIKKIIFKELDNSSMSQEKKQALKFMILGENPETKYHSILEIEEDMFLECVNILDEWIKKPKITDFTNLNADSNLQSLWQNYLLGGEHEEE